jgi:hypothetical protein
MEISILQRYLNLSRCRYFNKTFFKQKNFLLTTRFGPNTARPASIVRQ